MEVEEVEEEEVLAKWEGYWVEGKVAVEEMV